MISKQEERDMYESLIPAKAGTTTVQLSNPGYMPMVFCEHANESPSGGWCRCPTNCGCRQYMCAYNRFEGSRAEAMDKQSAFSKMHFEIIAQLLRECKAEYNLICAFADKFADANPRFNRDRFMGACGCL